MLSTSYRLKLEEICQRIIRHEEVSLEEMIWANKLGKANITAGTMLRQAQRKSENPTMQEGDLDDFLNQLDLGGTGNNRFGISRFNSPDEIAEWFKREDDNGEWRKRD